MRKRIKRKATMLFVRLSVWSLGMAMNVSGSKNMAVELTDVEEPEPRYRPKVKIGDGPWEEVDDSLASEWKRGYRRGCS
jgi:hypothetical protein